TRGRLSCNGDIWCTDNQRCLELNDARNIEYNDTRTSLFASLPQCPRTVVFQAGDDVNFSTAAAKGIGSSAFGTWKSSNLCLWHLSRTACPRHVRFTLLCIFL